MIDPFHDMRTAIAGTALVLGGLSFGVHLVFSARLAAKEAEEARRDVRALMTRASADGASMSTPQVAELAKALAALVDSLVKAGPALWSMIGSLLFLMVACTAAGVFTEAPEAPSPGNKAPPPAEAQPGPSGKHVEPPPPIVR
jgi:hypothetical protein